MESKEPNASKSSSQPVSAAAAQPVASAPVANASAAPKKKKTGLIWGLVGGGVALIVAIVLIVVFLVLPNKGSSDDPVVNAMLQGSLISVEVDGKYGYINTDGQIVIQPIFKKADQFHGNFAVAKTDDGETLFIDRSGNIKMRFDYAFYEYYDETGDWLIDYKLYDNNLNLISAADMKVTEIYDVDDYYEFVRVGSKKGGMLDATGKVMFEVDIDDEDDFRIRYSEPEYEEIVPYCGVFTGKKIIFLECANGKVVAEIDATRVDHLGADENNIFWAAYDDDDKEYPGYYKYYYIQDGEILLEEGPNRYSGLIDDYLYSGTLGVYNPDGRDKRFDICEKKYIDGYSSSSCKLTEVKDNEDNFEAYSGYKINGGMVSKGDEVIIPDGRYSRFEPLDRITYLYLKALGKDYIMAEKGSNTFVVNLANGEAVRDLGEVGVTLTSESTFIRLREDGETAYYNLVSDKIVSPENMDYAYPMIDYLVVRTEDDKYEFYNTEFKKFYVSDER